MPSVHHLPGKKNWICFYKDRDGKRRCRSTLTTSKREAQRVCSEIQMIEDRARAGGITHDKARKVIEATVNDILESFGSPVQRRSIAEHFESFLKNLELEASAGTFARYRGVVGKFLAFIGPKKTKPLPTLTSDDVAKYRDSIAGKVSNLTVNTDLKVLRVALEKAVREGLFDKNPARLVDNLDRKKSVERRPFTEIELRKILAVASEDWRTAILLSLYTGGQRLGDVVNAAWSHVDLVQKEIVFTARKTGRLVLVPISPPLLRHLETLAASDDPKAPLCPALAGRRESSLSNEFYELMATAGLVESRAVHVGKGRGRTTKRNLSAISFHSLRYTATTMLKSAGVSDAIARDLVGHESAAVSQNYTRFDRETKAAALGKLPDFGK